jgi:hypothetical protein
MLPSPEEDAASGDAVQSAERAFAALLKARNTLLMRV